MDFIVINKQKNFQHNSVFESGLSDFHLLIVTKFLIDFQKQNPKITYCKYETLDNEKFRSSTLKHNFDKSSFDS